MAEVETHNIEHKASLSERREIVESVAAFSTADGGIVHIGVKPDGTRVGVQSGRGSIEGLANEIKQNTDPRIFPNIEIDEEGGKEFIRVVVSPAPIKPVYAYDIPYIRVGRSNQKMTSEAAYELRQRTLGQTWDGLTTLGVPAAALPGETLTRMRRRLPKNAGYSPESLLTSLGLEKDGVAINAAVLLLDERLQAFLPQAIIKCARIKGRAGFAQNPVTFSGTIIEQIDDALAYVLDQTNTVSISGSAERKVIYQYPPDALREGIVNAVCHRDYTQTDPVHIRLYDDHLEIWNPGELPAGLTVEALFRDHPSRPRNPRLASVLDKLGYVEQFGSGTLRMTAALESADQPRPVFSSSEGVFRARFYRRNDQHPVLGALSGRQLSIMARLRTMERLTASQLATEFGINKRTLLLDLKVLTDAGISTHEGAGPSTYYQTTEEWRLHRVDQDEESARQSEGVSSSANRPNPALLTQRQRDVLALLKRRGRLTASELSAGLKLNRRTLQLDLKHLVACGVATMQGSGPTTFYVPVPDRDH